MTKKFSKRGIAVRMLLLVLIPMFWGLLFYFAGRPADVRTRNGITITMEEPFGSWRYDERLAKDCPHLADSLRATATGDVVYRIRSTYFYTLVQKQVSMVCIALIVLLLAYELFASRCKNQE